MPAKKSPKRTTAPKRAASARKRTSAKSSTVGYDNMKSFMIYKSPEPFFSTFSNKYTKQSIYWIVLLLTIIITQSWILSIQYNLMQVLDSL